MSGRTSRILLLGLSSALLFIIGCTPSRSYLEPRSIPRELIASALISTPSPVRRDGMDLIRIVAVDGQQAEYLDNKLFVTPGVHTIQVAVELRRNDPGSQAKTLVTRADTSLTFKAEANGSYVIDAREDNRGVYIWATDTKTSYVVAGNPPPRKRSAVQ